MLKLRGVFMALMLFVATFAYAQQQAGTCAPSFVPGNGLNDGCSVPKVATWLFPDVGIFKSTFTPACVNHDHCYSSLGSNYTECNDNFLADMKSACASTYSPLLSPTLYLACTTSANNYYSGVVAYSVAINPLGGIQQNALTVSQHLGASVISDQCATTPELSGLYDASVIAQVNSAYQAYAHRLPSIYEFMVAVNDGNLPGDRATWNSLLIQHAIAGASNPPPSVNLTWSAVQQAFSVTNPTPSTTYSWYAPMNLKVSADGTRAAADAGGALYNTTVTVSGILRAKTIVNGVAVENQVIVTPRSVTVRGTCGPSKGNPCV